MQFLSYGLGLVVLVCWILTLIKIFQDKEKNGVLHGIIGIVTCGIWALIWGWMNTARYGNKNIMILYTACYAANLIINLMFLRG